MVKQLVLGAVMVAGLAACGGKKGATTPTEDTEGTRGGAVTQTDGAADMVAPEKLEEITRLLDRKRGIMSRCLAIAVDNKELPKNSHGQITLDIVITPGGHADPIKVIKSSLESKSLEECVIGHVKSIQFPDLPKPYPTSYTYAFEAM